MKGMKIRKYSSQLSLKLHGVKLGLHPKGKTWPHHSSGGQLTVFTMEARVCARVNPCGICGGQTGIGTGFSEFFVLPVHIIPPRFSILYHPWDEQ
jgi:hypothetical protein